jgi:hypothetical protein
MLPTRYLSMCRTARPPDYVSLPAVVASAQTSATGRSTSPRGPAIRAVSSAFVLLWSAFVLLCALAALLLMPRAAAARRSSTGILLGDDVVGSQHGSLPAGRPEAFRFRARESGLADQVRLYIGGSNAAGKVVVGIYDDRGGRPGALLGQGALSPPQDGAWNTLTLTPSHLRAGSIYWLAVLGEHGTLRFRASLRSRCHSSTTAAGGSALPESWDAGHARVHTRCAISAYAVAASLPRDGIQPAASSFPPSASSPLAPSSPVSTPPGSSEEAPRGEVAREKEGFEEKAKEKPRGKERPREEPKEEHKEEKTEEPKEEPKEEPPPPPPAPVNKTPPAIGGTTTEGDTLTATAGTWENSPTGYEYQWQDCNAGGSNCLDIAGATTNAHKLTAGDVGHPLRVLVTATNEGGSTPAASHATATVEQAKEEPPPPPPAPVNKTPPAISGTTTEGDTLTATAGTWENSPIGYEYQWQDCNTSGSGCTNISGATSNAHKLTAGDVGHTLRAIVTATNEGGSTPATSAASAQIAKAPPPKPKNKTLPTISGTMTEGETLTAANGTWENSPTKYAYQWQDCNTSGGGCANIAGATGKTRVLAAFDAGHTLRIVVTASNEGGSAAATSAATAVVAEKLKEEPKEEPAGEQLFIAPSGSDANACTEAKPCKTMNHAYEVAKAPATVRMLAGTYSDQTIEGNGAKSSSARVAFEPASGASVKVTGTIIIYASHLTLENLAIQDVTIGNFEQDNGVPNPTEVTLKNLTGRNFEIDSATHITVEGGSWGPATACTEVFGDPYEGDNNAIRQPIASQAPEYITIADTTIHNVQSADLIECHIEGLAIFAGNHVTVSNSKFYENSVYDVFMQANSGGNPDNVKLAGNWFATAVDTTGKNGQAVGAGDGIAVGNELSDNVTIEDNHFNDALNMNDAEEISRFSSIRVVGNVGIQPYSGYNCAGLSGIEWSKNIWQNDKCSASDVNLEGAALPYVNASNGPAMNYTLTGKYAGWPEAGQEETKKEEKKEEPKEEKKEEGKKEESGSAGTLYLSPSGSDSAACTQSAPCKTLAHAYSVAKASEKVQLAAGTYADTSLPLTSGKTAADPVVFEPASGAAVKFSKEVRIEAHGVELKGFKFEKELYFGENAEGDTARDNALHNFEIISSGTKAPKDISIVGGTAGPVADGSDNENNLIATNGPETTAVPTKITVEGVLIHEYTKVGEAHVDCLQIWGGDELTIQDNTFEKCSVFDIFLQALPNGDAGTPKNVTIQNNYLEKTIEGYFSIFLPHHNEGNSEHYENIDIRNNSATQTICADPRATFTNVKFDGNIAPSLLFWNEETEVDQSLPSGAEAEYNVWYGSGAKKYGTHDQLAAAGFVDEATLDLELTEGAAAIKHGDPSNYPATDINGNTRPDPPDAGAAQYTG